jgi:hypothetical protein
MKKIAWVICVLALAMVAGCASSDDAQRSAEPGSANVPAPSEVASSTPTAVATESTGAGAAERPETPDTPSSAPVPAIDAAAGSKSSGAATPAVAPTAPAAAGVSNGASAAAPVAPSAAASGTAGAAAGAPPPSGVATGPAQIPADVLTAGTWDDNRNFDRFTSYRDGLIQAQTPGILPSTDDEHAQAHTKFANVHGARQTLDVSLVIDTTGSMGDEIAYLQSEFESLSETIEAKYPNAQQQWSLVAYRDIGDDYVTRVFDFRTDANDFRDKLGQLVAGGGGDFPEAPNAAIAAMNGLQWRTDDATARLAFWVADAPHHDDKAQAMLDAIRGARDLDVHIYPVASSGVNEMTELTMREAAQLTGGRYLFLTDDSGIGGEHKEPSIPCYFVTHLDQAILRMVDIELSGMYREPTASEIVRTGGDPQDGACMLDSGQSVAVF